MFFQLIYELPLFEILPTKILLNNDNNNDNNNDYNIPIIDYINNLIYLFDLYKEYNFTFTPLKI